MLAFLWLAGPAIADVAYPVYACQGPRLVHVSPQELAPQELAQIYPVLGKAPIAAMAVLIKDGLPRWTTDSRDALRARCLAGDDAARAPHRGQWDLVGPVFDSGACETSEVTAPLHGFPRGLTFDRTFHPSAILGTSPAGWHVLRDPDNFIWYAFAAPPDGLPALRGLSYSFHPGGPDLVVIEGTFQTSSGCADAFSLSLIRYSE